ncbi:MAG: hypothetical protein RRX93_05275 [Bacteroidales bacterium]
MATKKVVKKISKIVSYDKLDPKIKALFDAKYTDGYENFVTRYPKPNGEYFYAVSLDTEEVNYMIKVDVAIDVAFDEEDFPNDIPDDSVETVREGENTDVNDLADTLSDDFSEPV